MSSHYEEKHNMFSRPTHAMEEIICLYYDHILIKNIMYKYGTGKKDSMVLTL